LPARSSIRESVGWGVVGELRAGEGEGDGGAGDLSGVLEQILEFAVVSGAFGALLFEDVHDEPACPLGRGRVELFATRRPHGPTG
jgi:hypothetical protein